MQAQLLKKLGKALNEAAKVYNEVQDSKNKATRDAADRYEEEKRVSYQELKERGFDIDPAKMAAESRNNLYGSELSKANEWEESSNQNETERAINDIKLRLEEYNERKNEELIALEEALEEARIEREEAEREAQLEQEEEEREAWIEQQAELWVQKIQNINTEAISANIEHLWVEYNVLQEIPFGTNGRINSLGMKIHINFSVLGMLNKQGLCCAYFHFEDGTKLSDKNGSYTSADGQVCVGIQYIPLYQNSIFNNFSLFIPLNELHLGRGNHSLKFQIYIFDDKLNSIAYSDYIYFTYNGN